MANYSNERRNMVEQQLAARGITDQAVLDAMNQVPREEFVPVRLREFAYRDSALPIVEEQTISQPYIVALMTELLELKPQQRVLEIGTGSGYAAAILSKVATEVFTIERHQALANGAAEIFNRLGYDNIHVRRGDGTLGWPEEAPFDAIIVAAGGPRVPSSLKEQLAIGGRLVMPTGNLGSGQKLLRVRRLRENEYQEEQLGAVRFVPLIGNFGWHESDGDLADPDYSDPTQDLLK